MVKKFGCGDMFLDIFNLFIVLFILFKLYFNVILFVFLWYFIIFIFIILEDNFIVDFLYNLVKLECIMNVFC